jgi:hypothetical protein
MMHQSNENKMTEGKISILHPKDINAYCKIPFKKVIAAKWLSPLSVWL